MSGEQTITGPETDYMPDPNAPRALSESEAMSALTKFADPVSAQPRDPATKQFTAKQPAQPSAPVVDLKTGKPVEKPAQVGHNGGPELEEEFFEWAPEKEGEPPRRVKADEVFAAYDELPKLKKELEEARRPAAPPQQFMEEVRAVVETRQKYLNALEWAQQIGRPQPPDPALRDPRSPAYDPDAYARAMIGYEDAMGEYRQRHGHLQQQMQQQQEQQAALFQMQQRAAEPVILKEWPELADASKRNAIFADVEKVLGVTADELRNVPDPKIWSIVRDALAFRQGQQKQAEAAKVVRSKPKFVKGSARETTASNADARSAAIAKLASTGSQEDALAALSLFS